MAGKLFTTTEKIIGKRYCRIVDREYEQTLASTGDAPIVRKLKGFTTGQKAAGTAATVGGAYCLQLKPGL